MNTTVFRSRPQLLSFTANLGVRLMGQWKPERALDSLVVHYMSKGIMFA
jgi:hypothetical protein